MCGYRVLRITASVINSFLLIAGIVLIVLSVIAENVLLNSAFDFDVHLHGFVTAALAIYCCMTIVALIGVCGTCYAKTCLIITATIALVMVIFTEILCIIAGCVLHENVRNWVGPFIEKSVKDYWNHSGSSILMDYIQSNLHCCGSTLPSNYGNFTPHSCYLDDDIITGRLHTVGCIDAATAFLKRVLTIFLCTGAGFTLLQGVDVMFSYMLYLKIKRNSAFSSAEFE
ncbi:hypothetical protein EG68_01795 [Paragonimus skrjabini miyazakii]|uniref:Tetraspanin n=1 Tax=Paragonimus skrjabini miyazakii TaxID=59628 RepID=A0A8S9ZBP0_9TREM|nr:hypothetical protein EG68_01795 [Paragonimus skrjabini miyazakii]